MAENTPLLKQECDVPRYNTVPKTYGEVEGEENEPVVHEAEYEIPMLEIVNALLSEWERNGANEDLSPAVIMAMHLAYRRVTGGRPVFHAQYAIVNKLSDAMFRSIQRTQFFLHMSGLHEIQLRRNILKNLLESWSSIINFDEEIARDLNAYHPPTCRERIQNFWTKCQIKYAALQNSFSHLAGQLLIIIFLLGWPLSLLVMGVMFRFQCPLNRFLPDGLAAIGLMGIIALSLRLVLACVEEWCWHRSRTTISCFWNVLKFLEFVFLLLLNVLLWVFLRDSPGFDPKDLNFCNETFYCFMLSMKYVSTAFASVWVPVHLAKLVLWATRHQFHYRPLFHDFL